MLRPCFPWMLLTAGDLDILGLPGPAAPAPPIAPLFTLLDAGELLRFFPSSRPSAEWWLKLLWCSEEDDW